MGSRSFNWPAAALLVGVALVLCFTVATALEEQGTHAAKRSFSSAQASSLLEKKGRKAKVRARTHIPQPKSIDMPGLCGHAADGITMKASLPRTSNDAFLVRPIRIGMSEQDGGFLAVLYLGFPGEERVNSASPQAYGFFDAVVYSRHFYPSTTWTNQVRSTVTGETVHSFMLYDAEVVRSEKDLAAVSVPPTGYKLRLQLSQEQEWTFRLCLQHISNLQTFSTLHSQRDIKAAAADHSVAVKVGERFSWVLDENPTGGVNWELVPQSEDASKHVVLVAAEEERSNQDDANSQRQVFVFQAIKEGSGQVVAMQEGRTTTQTLRYTAVRV